MAIYRNIKVVIEVIKEIDLKPRKIDYVGIIKKNNNENTLLTINK